MSNPIEHDLSTQEKESISQPPAGFFANCLSAAQAFDAFIERVTDKPLDRLYEKNKARAMENHVYAEIERRRHRDNESTVVMYSDELHLGHEEMDLQRSIFDSVAKNPWWTQIIYKVRNINLTKRLNSVKFAHQRLTRGWDDRATWSLDDHLCQTLGAQLIHLADTSHGWPESEEFPTFEIYAEALKKHGNALTKYPSRWEVMDDEKEDQMRNDAQASLRWVADHLGTLWD